MQGLLGLIVIVLVFFFGWGMQSGGIPPVATVNGDSISYELYQQSYDSLIKTFQEVYKDELTTEKIKEMDLKKRALDQLIDQTLLMQEADRLGIWVTDDDVRRGIESVEVFHEGGRFNRGRYLTVLEANRRTPKEYESAKKHEMLISMVETAIKSNAQVADEEIRKEFEEMNTKLEINFVSVRSSGFEPDVQVNDQDLRDYFEAEKESFRTEKKLSAKYILFTPDAFVDAATAAENEIKQEFNWRADEFAVKEAVRARHILFRLAPGAKTEEEAAIKAKADDLRKKIMGGQDFAELAATYSEDPGSKNKGGDLGYFERGNMVPEFEETAFALEPKTVSEPIKTQFGFHLIYVEDHRAAQNQKLADVKDKIVLEIKNRKALEEAYYAAKNVWMDLEDGVETWEKLAQTRKVEKTASIVEGGLAAGVTNPKEFTDALFGMTPDDKGILIETEKGTYLLAVDISTPAAIPAFEDVKAKVEAKYRSVTAKTLAEKKAADFLAAARSNGWDEAVKALNLKSQDSGQFAKKGGAIPKIGWAPEFKEQIIALKEIGSMVEKPHEVNSAFYIAKLAGITEADASVFEEQKEQIRDTLLRKAQTEYFAKHLEDLKLKADLEIEEKYLL